MIAVYDTPSQISRMNTKLSQIEKSLKLKYRLENNNGFERGGAGGAGGPPTRAPSAGGPAVMGSGDGAGFGHPRNRENEQLVEELHRYNSVLLRENSDLKTKIKVRHVCSRGTAERSRHNRHS